MGPEDVEGLVVESERQAEVIEAKLVKYSAGVDLLAVVRAVGVEAGAVEERQRQEAEVSFILDGGEVQETIAEIAGVMGVFKETVEEVRVAVADVRSLREEIGGLPADLTPQDVARIKVCSERQACRYIREVLGRTDSSGEALRVSREAWVKYWSTKEKGRWVSISSGGARSGTATSGPAGSARRRAARSALGRSGRQS